MTMFKIYGKEKQGYTTTFFIKTIDGIYVENEEIGFFKHPKIQTEKDLYAHFKKMADDGFKVDVAIF